MTGLIIQPPLSSGNLIANVRNLTPAAARYVSRMKGGLTNPVSTRRGRVLCVGDSRTAGTAAPDLVNYRRQSYPAQVAAMLSAAGLSCTYDNVCGQSGRTLVEYLTYNPKVTFPGGTTGWISAGASKGPGGPMFSASSGTTAMRFTPTATVDTFVMKYPINTGLGSFSWAVDGGAATTVSQSGTAGIGTLTINSSNAAVLATPGAHYIELVRVSGQIYVGEVLWAYNSTTNAIDFFNMGWSGSTPGTDWVDTAQPWYPLATITNMAPDLTIIDLGTNNYGGTNYAAFKASMQSIIDAASPSGDVWLMPPGWNDTALTTDALQNGLQNAVRELAQTNNLVLLDQPARTISYANMNGLGLMLDQRHETGVGYSFKAALAARAIMGA